MGVARKTIWIAATLAVIGVSTAWDRRAYGGPFRDEPTSRPDADRPDDEEGKEVNQLRRLTDAEINRIRYIELRGSRLRREDRPDAVKVDVPAKTVDDFLLDMTGHPDFREETLRHNFRKMTPAQKLHLIAFYKGTAYIDKVTIKSDPDLLERFKKRIMPIVLQSCATNGCHTHDSDNAGAFRLYKDPKLAPATTYADFIMLCDQFVNEQRVINRAKPDDSLLLTCMLPQKDVRPELRHPGHVEYRPISRTRRDPKYQMVLSWIKELKHPAEDYGVHVLHAGGATSRPAEDPPIKPLE